MHKNYLWFMVMLFIVYLMLVFCEETTELVPPATAANAPRTNDGLALMNEGRLRNRHKLFNYFGWQALAIAYWIKVKIVVVAFIVGWAIFWGVKYFWPNKCGIHEGPIYYDHPPHHSTIPYAFDHGHFDHGHFDHSFSASSFSPYSSYEGGVISDDGPPPSLSGIPADHHSVKRRSTRRETLPTEAQIAEFMFYFLGLDSKACRRRFICEMEFRSRLHPLTRMGFRIVSQGFFERYLNAHNENGQASSFMECAAVNPECVFIEQSETADPYDEQDSEVVEINQPIEMNYKHPTNTQSVKDNEVLGKDDMEQRNAMNLKAERQTGKVRRRGDRQMDLVAQRILGQLETN